MAKKREIVTSKLRGTKSQNKNLRGKGSEGSFSFFSDGLKFFNDIGNFFNNRT